MIYLIIFLAKTLENTLCTFRLIVVSNGKKMLGAVLNAIISLIWVITTGLVVIKGFDVKRIISFCFGCFIGSYLGSYLEEKTAIGSNMILCITTDEKRESLRKALLDQGFKLTYTRAGDKNQIQNMLFILAPRKQRMKILEIIKKIDSNAVIISENATLLEEKKHNMCLW